MCFIIRNRRQGAPLVHYERGVYTRRVVYFDGESARKRKLYYRMILSYVDYKGVPPCSVHLIFCIFCLPLTSIVVSVVVLVAVN